MRRWQVRPARGGDREVLLALLHDIDQLHAALQPAFFRRDAGRAAALGEWLRSRGDTALLVAEDARRRVAGMVRLSLYDAPAVAFMVKRRRALVEELVVTPARRRSGCGRALVAAAIEWARAAGAEQLLLTVWSGNTGAERFYRALGWSAVSKVLGTEL